MKRFNVTGLCMPEEDYMADISEKTAEIYFRRRYNLVLNY